MKRQLDQKSISSFGKTAQGFDNRSRLTDGFSTPTSLRQCTPQSGADTLTRKALFISLIFHLFFFMMTFYFVMRNQPIPSVKASLEAELISVAKVSQLKPPPKTVAPRLRVLAHKPTNPVSTKMESPLPIAAAEVYESHIRPMHTVAINTPQPVSEETLTAPELSKKSKGDISTAARTLRDIEQGLTKTGAASAAGSSTFGAKRLGPPGMQRTPRTSTIKITEFKDDISAAQLADIREKRKGLPQIPFRQLMKGLAEDIVETSEGGPIDVVFVIDASGSMGDNINAVAEHLTEMIDVYKAAKIDYALGLTQFWTRERRNVIKVLQLTKSLAEYKRTIQAITTHHDEHALDAIVHTVREMRFRPTSKKHFILVTDEPFTSVAGLEVKDAIAHCLEFGIYVNVLGLPDNEHQALAAETGGKWHIIPENRPAPQIAQRYNTAKSPRAKIQTLRKAQWENVRKIGNTLLQHSTKTQIDIILFIDGSKSMEDKLPHFLKQLDMLARDLDNALVDYQLGVVRFRARAGVNMVTVFHPPQTLDQIRKIAELPCQENEMLLDAVAEGLRRIKLRPNAQPHLILITDEPAAGEHSALAIIQLLQQRQAFVSVIGTYDDFQQQVAMKTGGMWVPIPEGHTKNNPYW